MQYIGSLGSSAVLHKKVTKEWVEKIGLPLLCRTLDVAEDSVQFERFEHRADVKLVVLQVSKDTVEVWGLQPQPFLALMAWRMVPFRDERQEKDELRSHLEVLKTVPAPEKSSGAGDDAGAKSASNLVTSIQNVSVGSETAGDDQDDHLIDSVMDLDVEVPSPAGGDASAAAPASKGQQGLSAAEAETPKGDEPLGEQSSK